MLVYLLKQAFKYISSNLLLILNICYYIRKFNYCELFNTNESSSSDLIKININLNITDLVIISIMLLIFKLMPYLKRTLFSQLITNERIIIDTYLTKYLNDNKFKITVLDNKSILIENDL